MIDQWGAAGGGEFRLDIAADDFKLEPDLRGDTFPEFRAIGRCTAGLGRNQARARHSAVLHLVPADGERIDRTRNRLVVDTARSRDALAEPDDAGEGVDNPECVPGR